MKLIRKSMIVLVATLLMTCMFAGIQGRAETAPGEVTELKQTSASRNKLGISWKPLSNDVGYKLELKTIEGMVIRSDDVDYLDDTDYEDDMYSFLQLSPGTSYKLSVQAYLLKDKNAVGEASEIEVVTGPEGTVPYIKQDKADSTSVSLTWGAVDGATGYSIQIRSDGGNWKAPIYVAGTSAEFKNLKADSKYDFQILAVRKSDLFTAEGEAYECIYLVPTLPGKVTGLKYNTFNASKGKVSFNCGKRATAAGYQCNIYDGKTLVATIDSKSNTNINVQSAKLKNKYKFFNAKVCAYMVVNGVKQYGDWSDTIYLSPAPTGTLKWTSKGIKVNWKKISGSTNYTVYISTKKNAGLKNAGTTTKNNMLVKKYGKSKLKNSEAYYIYIVANKKVGKTTYTSLPY